MGCCIKPQSRIQSRIINHLTEEEDFDKISKIIPKLNNNSVFDLYAIHYKLGAGSFGTVYKVSEKKTKIPRALKMIRREVVQMQDGKYEFLREIEILRQIDHPNIVKLLEFFIDDNFFYLILELIDGIDLYSYIHNREDFTENQAAVIMKQLFSAVFYLHSKNIVHRDIKPDNIMILKDGNGNFSNLELKLIDFGTCIYLKPGKFLKRQIGTPIFLSPECIKGKYNQSTDVWACGVTLHILLVGYPPFNGKEEQELMENIKACKLNVDSTELCKVSDMAKDILKLTLTKDRMKRISAEEAIKHGWIEKFNLHEEINELALTAVVRNLKNFNIRDNFQKKAIAYIVHLMEHSKEHEHLSLIFKEMDQNGDGRLSYKELKAGFNKVFDQSFTEMEFEKIYQSIEKDKDGFIEYNKFLRVTLNTKLLMSEANLKIAFDKFDLRGSGKLNLVDIKAALGYEKSLLIDELKETDEKDEIDFPGFCELMQGVFVNFKKANSVLMESFYISEFENSESFSLNANNFSAKAIIKDKIRFEISNLSKEKAFH